MALERVEVRVPVGSVRLDGNLAIPSSARGIVVFAHGSGSSRFSPRNRLVAADLQQGGFATLLVDLLTPDEEQTDRENAQLRFDIGLLGERVFGLVKWVRQQSLTRELKIGVFGASTGVAAALVAAANMNGGIWAIVSRGGRPDLAGTEVLSHVQSPTLLIVGGDDEPVITLNREAFEALKGEKQLEIVPGATHLFEEPGALETVARLACDWFERYLVPFEQHRVA